MPNYHIWTIGCQMNKAESERIASLFERKGYRHTPNAAQADFIVLNTCVVRQNAEDRAVNKLRNLKPLKKSRPDLKIAVTGCWVDSNTERLKTNFPYVDYLFKAGDCPPWEDRNEWSQALPEQPQVSTYVPIIQGCNNFCAYCIVPYRRGRERSRPLSEVVCEVKELVKRGTREVTLLGQNVDSYGHDLPDKPELADLLTELTKIDGLYRIRFLTNHPKDMSKRLIQTIARLDKVCKNITLPVQAGSNEILKAMRRGYTIEDYRRLIGEIRLEIPDVALSNDIIVGFPTETIAQFQQTVDLLTELRFDVVHIAAYSPRSGTIAARKLADDVPPDEKKRRLLIIEQLQEKITAEINAGLMGKTIEVLVEGKEKGKWYGRTGSDKLVFFSDNANHTGKLVHLKIESTGPWSLQGTVNR
ncbi:MAG: tRNA (N6-isopentenyl adenosine(37)-C2)-methylthiotransferase MiaB [Dehalococcoidales bacterium]|nr:tRNA (N6-isopentenyl adenosine(37)-C2)-methylthiotransferase MiaB [Dehalococcoidales bacterium]